MTRRDDPVILLNQDLMGEHQAIVHYLTHAFTVVRQYGDSIEAIARDEMRHFKWLAHAIVALEGVPDLTPPHLLPVYSGVEALDYDINAEEEAISQYLSHRRDIADERVQNLISRIVVDERDHRRQFIGLREKWVSGGTDDMPERGGDERVVRLFQTAVSREYQEILRSLMESFLQRHVRAVGLDAEDRAVDEMKHMSWIAQSMVDAGGMPRLNPSEGSGHAPEPDIYRELEDWAEAQMPGLVPLIVRVIQHEEYHQLVTPPG